MHLKNIHCLNSFLSYSLFYTLTISLLFYGNETAAQNLVPNPSFELANCPTGYNGYPSQVELYTQGWYAANCGSPDPMTNCSINTGQAVNTSIPDVWFGSQYARTGNNYMGFGHYNFTEFLGTRLLSPLVAGKLYKISFYVSCADQVKYASDALGMYFSTTQVKASSGGCLSGAILNYTPQVVSTPGVFLTDYAGWMEVSGSYTALGGEEYIAIGCFVPFNTTTMNHLYNFGGAADPAYTNSPAARLYYYLDDVSVEVDPMPVKLISFDAEKTNQKTTLRWTTTDEVNFCRYEIQKSRNAEAFVTIDTIRAMSAATNVSYKEYQYIDEGTLYRKTYYRLKQIDCNGDFSFSKIITANSSLQISVHPNPVGDVLEIHFNNEIPSKVILHDMFGQTLYTFDSISENALSIPFCDFPKGVYTLVIDFYEGERIYRKIVKQ